jgi:hypothetical protein
VTITVVGGAVVAPVVEVTLATAPVVATTPVTVDTAVEELDVRRRLAERGRAARRRGASGGRSLLGKTEPALVGERYLWIR